MNHIVCVELVKRVFPEIKTFIDIGANEGSFSKVVLSRFKNPKVFSFEPLKSKDVILKDIVDKNFVTALSDKSEDREFYISEGTGSKSSLNKILKKKWVSTKKIKTARFDSLDIEIESPCFVKIDTEGNELKVLEGFGDRLNEVDIIQFEHNVFFKKKLSEIVNYLEGFGFSNFVTARMSFKEDGNLGQDIVCWKKKGWDSK